MLPKILLIFMKAVAKKFAPQFFQFYLGRFTWGEKQYKSNLLLMIS